jgi:hypothetical protein
MKTNLKCRTNRKSVSVGQVHDSMPCTMHTAILNQRFLESMARAADIVR